MEMFDGSITSPLGYRAAGVACGLKKNGLPDLALVVSDCPATAVGVFTRNIVKGHSLQLSRANIQNGLARAVIINSGNANACVGEPGMADARSMAEWVAVQAGCPANQVMTGSTGVIGKRLNMEAIRSGIDQAFMALEATPEAGHRAERAIMTTDTVPKECAVRFQAGGQTVTIAGMAKGSGMIRPNMATMISVITADCAVDQGLLQDLLHRVTDRTFNRVSVDGDTSVCDMVIAMGNGLAGNPAITAGSAEALLLEQALELVSTYLARLIAQDGEGATKLIEIIVRGAKSDADAYKIVSAIAHSPLVKTAMFGEDANCGRILTAAGYSGADFDPANCDIYLGDLKVFEKGVALLFDEEAAKNVLHQKEVLIRFELTEGTASDRMWTCDFSYDYVKINGSYRT